MDFNKNDNVARRIQAYTERVSISRQMIYTFIINPSKRYEVARKCWYMAAKWECMPLTVILV